MLGAEDAARRVDELYATVFPPRRRDSIADVRGRFDAMFAAVGARPGVSVTEIDVAGVPALQVRAAEADRDGAVLWLHGGGYTIGSARGYAGFAAELSAARGVPVIVLEYRLAPEHKFPAAVDDAVAATRWLVQHHGGNAGIGGDSAGGGLVLAALSTLRDAGETLPSRAVVIAPVADLTASGASFDVNATTDRVLSRGSVEQMRLMYLQGADPTDPRASPGLGELHGLPPTRIVVSADEVLLDDARMVAEKLASADVPHELVVGEGQVHVWPLFAPLLPDAVTEVGRMAAHLDPR